MKFPEFKYHPDPLKTKSVVKSEDICECCLKRTGYKYEGSIYGRSRVENLCPWCIGNGEAHRKFEAKFSSIMPGSIGSQNPVKIECDDEAFDTLLHKTPGFSSYQEIEWPNHCNDFCEFHGVATVGDFKKISAEEKERLYRVSWLDETEILELQKGDERTELHYFFHFVCCKCGEFIFQVDPD